MPPVNFDFFAGGATFNCPVLTSLIQGASEEDQAALAAELSSILDASPGDVVAASLEVSGTSMLGITNVSGLLTAGDGLIADEVELDTGTKTTAATAGAATLNKSSGRITSEALTTAAGASYALTLANTKIAAGDLVFASVQFGTATTGIPVISNIAESANQVIITVENNHLTAALNGTIKISFFVVKGGTPT